MMFYLSILSLIISLVALFVAIRAHHRSDPKALRSQISSVVSLVRQLMNDPRGRL